MGTGKRLSDKDSKVLFIGPSRTEFHTLKEYLSKDGGLGVDAVWHRTLQEGLAVLAKRHFVVVLVDLSEHDGRGSQVVSAIRTAAPTAAILVILHPDEAPGSALAWGAQASFVKGRLQARDLAVTLEHLFVRLPSSWSHAAETNRAEVTLNSIADAVLRADAQGRITFLNLVGERMTGWSRQDADGRLVAEVLTLLDSDTRQPLADPLQLAAIDHKSRTAANGILVRRDGVETAIEGSVATIHDRNGLVTGAVMVFHDVSASRAHALKMSHLAQHDFLTDLPNRVLFNDRLNQAIAMARRHQRYLAVLFLDCDRFKEVNDTLGHSIGDLLLQSLSARLVGAVRTSDTVARHGGDEFVILLSELEHPDDALLCARKVVKALSTPHQIGLHELEMTASVGVAVYPADGRNADALIRNADMALYEAKESGRNTYRSFRPDMKTRVTERQSIEGDLMAALERGEFCLHYQPRVNLGTGAPISVEALLRWNHPERGLVPPGDFVAIAEECGLIIPIGRWVLGEACRQAAHWRAAGLNIGPMAVNVSAVEFRNAGSYLAAITDFLTDNLLDPDLVELELTESVLLKDTEATRSLMRSLRDLGVRLTLDDFGTGFSSLTYLQKFPISTLKIDRSFVRELSSSRDDRILVAAIIAMGKSLGRTVIAEGIETGEQLDVLREMSCEEGQGFHFCRPLPASAFANYLGTLAASPVASLH